MKKLKTDIRKEIKEQLKDLTLAERNRQSAVVFNQLETNPNFQQANIIMLFWSLPDEINTHKFIEKWVSEKKILLPVVQNNNLILKEFSTKTNMKKGAFNILEPTGVEFTNYTTIDMCIIPGIAFDKKGNRLGKGKGFYDRFLLNIKTKKIGVCFKFQLIEKIPSDSWDQKMDLVITSL